MVICDRQPAARRASMTLAKAGDIYWKISENPITSGLSRSDQRHDRLGVGRVGLDAAGETCLPHR